MTISIEAVRRRLLFRLWLLVSVVVTCISAYGWYHSPLRPVVRPVVHVFALLPPFRWVVLAPALLIVVFVLFEQSRSWLVLSAKVVGVGLLVLGGKIVVDIASRALIAPFLDPVVAARLMGEGVWIVGRYTSHLLADVQAWTLVVFAVYGGSLYLDRAEKEMVAEATREKLRDARVQDELARVQPRVIVKMLRRLTTRIASDPKRAVSELMELGDYLRVLIGHLRREGVSLEEELEAWKALSSSGEPGVEVNVQVDRKWTIRAGALLAVLERVRSERADHDPCVVSIRQSDQESLIISIESISSPSAGVLETYTISRWGEPETPTDEVQPASQPSSLTPRVVAFWFAGAATMIGLTAMLQVVIAPIDVLVGGRKILALNALADWGGWGVVGGAVVYLYLRSGRRGRLSHVVFLLALLVAPVLLETLILLANSDGSFVSTLGSQVFQWIFAVRAGFVFIGVIVLGSFEEVARALDEERVAASLRREYRLLRLRVIRSQLQPHFLLNTLHAVNALIRTDPQQAETLALQIADLMEETAEYVKEGFVTLSDEIRTARRYLAVLAVRYGDRVDYEIDVPTEIENVRVPALITQPLLENALIHGIESSSSRSLIVLRACDVGGAISLTVTNPCHREGRSGGGLGLENTARTLAFCYGDDFRFEIGVDHGLYRVDIVIPRNGEKECA